MADNLALKSFRLKNFKAVRDSGKVDFTPLTVFIGDNGSGKSSLVEGLQTYQRIITEGLDSAMQTWRGFEHIRNAGAGFTNKEVVGGRSYQSNPIEFRANHRVTPADNPRSSESQAHYLSVAASPNGDEVFIFQERFNIRGRRTATRNKEGELYDGNEKRFENRFEFPVQSTFRPDRKRLAGGDSLLREVAHYPNLHDWIASWQFVTLNPSGMGGAQLQQRTDATIRLNSDGSNIAEFLLDIRHRDPDAFEGLLETLQFVLPYVGDLQPALTDVLGRQVYLEMTEEDFKLMGWLLSTGTLRILALLALFRHPEPPPLIVIEEIENGLDPRTIHMIVEELRYLVETSTTQVIITTHSPYLLDLLALSHIVLVERVGGEPTFSRPANEESLHEWAKNFGAGHLYTMDKLSRRGRS